MKPCCAKSPTVWHRSTLCVCVYTGRSAPWFDADCRAARRNCRRLERRYRQLALLTIDVCGSTPYDKGCSCTVLKRSLLAQPPGAERRSPPQLWRSLSTVLGRDRDVTGATGHTADGFAKFFAQKFDGVRTATANYASPSVIQSANSTLSTFRPCTQADVRRIIMASPMKSCSLDPVPTFEKLLTFCCRILRAW